jgi:hypothetical protein
MALTLVKEDGTGKVDANSYADVADGDAYHDGHLYAAAWSGATNDDKEKALVFATRLIDSQFQFNGWRAHDEQALQWPRERCQDPDRGLPVTILLLPSGAYVDSNIVPKTVMDAACEMARELLIANRTASAPGEGIHSAYTAHMVSGGVSDISNTTYDKSDTRPMISKVAQAMLAKFGAPIKSGSGAVRLIRA